MTRIPIREARLLTDEEKAAVDAATSLEALEAAAEAGEDAAALLLALSRHEPNPVAEAVQVFKLGGAVAGRGLGPPNAIRATLAQALASSALDCAPEPYRSFADAYLRFTKGDPIGIRIEIIPSMLQ
jgi:hypothetical protein